MPKKQVSKKRQRVPFSGFRTRLGAKARRGYKNRWFNDVDDRVQRALDAGYTFVEDDGSLVGEGEIHQGTTDLNGKVSKVVSKNTQPPIRAFLMEIPLPYYMEDQASKEEVNRRVDDAIRAGTPGGATVEKGYVPSTGIKHEHS